jgi:dTDP-4-amino-4,6-dideoxygalactose transaminase
MKVPFLDLARSRAEFATEIDARILEVLNSGAYILGPNVSDLELAVADYLDVAHAVAVGSGTDALHLALAALGIGPADEVITTPFTFAATVEAIQYVGAQPVLIDIDADTYNIDANLIDAAITPRTRAILPVHLFGLPADMPRIVAIAEINGLVVIEDCAQCLGANIGGKATGAFGAAGTFSFYPTKTLGAFGDGGVVSTNDAGTDRRLRELRNHGIGDNGEHVMLGFNSRLDEIQAAALSIKLMHLDAMNDRRRQIAAHYNAVLSEAGATTQTVADDEYHVYGYYTLCVADRDGLRERLGKAGVATALYYGKPLHTHTHFSESCRFSRLPVAERIAGQCLSLPIFPEMTDAEVDYVATTTARLIA